MPSAFSGGDMGDDRVNRRREQDRANMEAESAIKAREAREARSARDAAAAKDRDALALNSETSYPSLGSNSNNTVAPSKFATNFRDKVAAMAAREKADEEMRALAAEAEYESSANWSPAGLSAAAAAHRRRTLIGNRCFDNGPEDYDGPEEDFGDNDISDNEDEGEGPSTNDTNEEFNAHLATTHRRGDKNSLY
jgi:hypothetical protein